MRCVISIPLITIYVSMYSFNNINNIVHDANSSAFFCYCTVMYFTSWNTCNYYMNTCNKFNIGPAVSCLCSFIIIIESLYSMFLITLLTRLLHMSGRLFDTFHSIDPNVDIVVLNCTKVVDLTLNLVVVYIRAYDRPCVW